jgi:hypothetical protein
MNRKFDEAIPSPYDSRDFKLAMFTPDQKIHPKEFHLPYMDIYNQGSVGGCVGCSLHYCRGITEMMQSGAYKMFSPGFIYGYREPDQWQGKGMIPRQALSNLLKIGAVLQDDFPDFDEVPYIIKKVIDRKDELIKLAKPYRISAYCRLYTIEEIKTALLKLGPVSIMIPVYGSIFSLNYENHILPIPNSTETLLGHHEMTLVGWRDDNTFDALNSWGEKWCDEGICHIPFDYPYAEAWSMSDNILPDSEMSMILKMKAGTPFYVLNDTIKYLDHAADTKDVKGYKLATIVAEILGAVVEWDGNPESTIIIRKV